MKTIIFIILSTLSFCILERADACQVQVRTQYQKNLLVAYAASEMNVDLSKATSIRTSDYSHQFSGAPDGYSCPTVMENRMRVEVSYRPNLLTSCSFSVIVHKREIIDLTVITVPLITITLESPVSGCTHTPIVPKPDQRLPREPFPGS